MNWLFIQYRLTLAVVLEKHNLIDQIIYYFLSYYWQWKLGEENKERFHSLLETNSIRLCKYSYKNGGTRLEDSSKQNCFVESVFVGCAHTTQKPSSGQTT